jgi:hypothetical protein
MIENLTFPDLIENILREAEHIDEEYTSQEVIDLVFKEYWNSDNIWLRNKWKQFRETVKNNLMFDIKSEYRAFKESLTKEIEFDYKIQLEHKGINKIVRNNTYYFSYSKPKIVSNGQVIEVEDIQKTTKEQDTEHPSFNPNKVLFFPQNETTPVLKDKNIENVLNYEQDVQTPNNQTLNQVFERFGINNVEDVFGPKPKKGDNIFSISEHNPDETREEQNEEMILDGGNISHNTFFEHNPDETREEIEGRVQTLNEIIEEEQNLEETKRMGGFLDKELLDENRMRRREKNMHPILVKYLRENEHFRAYSKTIDQSKSDNRIKGRNEWDHADIVAVGEEIYTHSKDNTLMEFLDIADHNFLRIFSFELKLKIDLTNLRQYFFQAVSNSSWSHEGYLVTLEFDRRNQRYIKEELKRLSSTFGIGVILLDVENLENTEIIFPAKRRDTLDVTLINKLLTVSKNSDFQEFIKAINDIRKIKEVNPTKFDKVLSNRDLTNFVNEHFPKNIGN